MTGKEVCLTSLQATVESIELAIRSASIANQLKAPRDDFDPKEAINHLDTCNREINYLLLRLNELDPKDELKWSFRALVARLRWCKSALQKCMSKMEEEEQIDDVQENETEARKGAAKPLTLSPSNFASGSACPSWLAPDISLAPTTGKLRVSFRSRPLSADSTGMHAATLYNPLIPFVQSHTEKIESVKEERSSPSALATGINRCAATLSSTSIYTMSDTCESLRNIVEGDNSTDAINDLRGRVNSHLSTSTTSASLMAMKHDPNNSDSFPAIGSGNQSMHTMHKNSSEIVGADKYQDKTAAASAIGQPSMMTRVRPRIRLVVTTNELGVIQCVNDKVSLALGYNILEMLDRSIFDFIHDARMASRLSKICDQAMKASNTHSELGNNNDSGSTAVVPANAAPTLNSSIFALYATDASNSRSLLVSGKLVALSRRDKRLVTTCLRLQKRLDQEDKAFLVWIFDEMIEFSAEFSITLAGELIPRLDATDESGSVFQQIFGHSEKPVKVCDVFNGFEDAASLHESMQKESMYTIKSATEEGRVPVILTKSSLPTRDYDDDQDDLDSKDEKALLTSELVRHCDSSNLLNDAMASSNKDVCARLVAFPMLDAIIIIRTDLSIVTCHWSFIKYIFGYSKKRLRAAGQGPVKSQLPVKLTTLSDILPDIKKLLDEAGIHPHSFSVHDETTTISMAKGKRAESAGDTEGDCPQHPNITSLTETKVRPRSLSWNDIALLNNAGGENRRANCSAWLTRVHHRTTETLAEGTLQAVHRDGGTFNVGVSVQGPVTFHGELLIPISVHYRCPLRVKSPSMYQGFGLISPITTPMSPRGRQWSVVSLPEEDSGGDGGDVVIPSVPQIISQSAVLDDYVIEGIVGEGAYGIVKSARKASCLEERVIIKLISRARVLPECMVEHLDQIVPVELHIMQYLQKHRHSAISSMIECFEDDQYYYLVTPKHGDGRDLFDFIEENRFLPVESVRTIFNQVVSAVCHLHSLGIIHRDIKDENVIIDTNTLSVQVVDFGSSAYIRPVKPNVKHNAIFSSFYGTIDYAPPEVLTGKSYTGPPQDIWSLGILLYTLIYKEVPFRSVSEILQGGLRLPFTHSAECVALIRKMLELDPEKRPSAMDVLKDPWLVNG